MWPSLETASHIADVANVFFIASLVVGLVSTFLIVWMANVKETHWDIDRRASSERIAQLNNETARLRGKEALTADAVLATAKATIANAVAAQFLLALSQQLAQLMVPGMKMPGFLSFEQQTQIVSKVKHFAGKQFDVDIDITSRAYPGVIESEGIHNC